MWLNSRGKTGALATYARKFGEEPYAILSYFYCNHSTEHTRS